MQIVPVRAGSEAALQAAYEKTPQFQFQGKAAQTHRLFVFSADLVHEQQSSPWSTVPAWRADLAGASIKWMLQQAGPADVLMFCDGRSRPCRAEIEKATSQMRHPSEIWLVFAPTERLGRRVSWASDNREVILISTPVARTLLPVTERAEFACAGEASTHDASYTGVPPAPWKSLPHLLTADKGKILGHAPEEPRPQLFDTSLGQPLFWAERKGATLWRRLYKDLAVKAVVDCTPGSGSAARAAMQLGLSYVGFARNSEHSNWLTNVLNRSALVEICTTGSILYHQDLSSCISQHFQEILAQVRDADGAKDQAPEDEQA